MNGFLGNRPRGRGLFGGQRKTNRDGGAGNAAPDLHLSLEQAHPLAHGGNAYASGVSSGPQTTALVGNFQGKKPAAAREQDGRGGAVRVAVNIGKAFLHNAKDRQFNVEAQLFEFAFGGQGNGNAAAPAEAFHVAAQGPAQAQLFQKRRVQQIGNCAQLAGAVFHQLYGFFNHGLRAGREAPGITDAGHIQGQCDKVLGGAVMQLAGQVAALLLLYAHHPPGKFLDLFFRALAFENFTLERLVAFFKIGGPVANTRFQLVMGPAELLRGPRLFCNIAANNGKNPFAADIEP